MNLDKAVEKALLTWYPKDHELHLNPHHPLGKLLGEWGELLDDYMKSLYKPEYVFEPEDELGDIWYYLRILCYQNNHEPRLVDNIIIPELDLDVNILTSNLDILIKATMYELSQYTLIKELRSVSTISTPLVLAIQYSVLAEILERHNYSVDQLTRSNWEKLKPGSERGEQWAKARAAKPEPMPKQGKNDYRIEYVGGKVEKSGWRVYQASWQSHRKGKPIETPKKNRRPRWKFRGVFETKELAEQWIKAND